MAHKEVFRTATKNVTKFLKESKRNPKDSKIPLITKIHNPLKNRAMTIGKYKYIEKCKPNIFFRAFTN